MKHAVKSLAIVLVLLFAGAASVFAQPQQVTLLHVGDTHSHLAAWGPKDANLDGTLGGLSKGATIVATEKATNQRALFVHAGDLMNGDPFFNEYLGVPEFLLLQSLGLDVFVPGNHEFQFGPDFLAGVLGTAWPAAGGVSIVGTNLDIGVHPLGLWTTPTAIKELDGVKVGFIGLTTPYDVLEQPAPVTIREDLDALAAQAVTELRDQGAQVVVCLAHLGLDLSRQLAQEVSGIDVIVNAHDHVALPQPETIERTDGTTLIVSAGEYYRYVGRLRLSIENGHVSLVDYALLSVDASTPEFPAVQPTVDYLKAGIVARYGDLYHEKLTVAIEGVADSVNPRKMDRDTPIGDLFTDAYRAWTNTDIAIEAAGFLDEGLPAGPIVGADIFRSMSYGLPVVDAQTGGYISRPFRLATFNLSGAALIAALETALAGPAETFPQVSGLRLQFDSSRSPGSRVLLDSVRVGNAKVDPTRVYSLAANEGLLLFLPLMGIEPQNVHVLDTSAFEAARAFVKERLALAPLATGRLRDVASIPGKSR